MISAPNDAGSPPSLAARPPAIGAEQDGDEGRAFDQRVAGRQLFALQMIGQDAVFDRPEQRRDDAEEEQRDEEDRRCECSQKPTTRERRDADLGELERCATSALSKRSAIWPPSPERKKNGAMKTAPASVISASRVRRPRA